MTGYSEPNGFVNLLDIGPSRTRGPLNEPFARMLLGVDLQLVLRRVISSVGDGPMDEIHAEAFDAEENYLTTVSIWSNPTTAPMPDPQLAAAIDTARSLFWERLGPREPDITA
jgi:hypothetical protein